jgi:hypothetical protein
MLTHEEHQAMIMFDRLLMIAEKNETVADLLDQALNVSRMIDPRPDDKVMYGPLQRMHFEWQEMKLKVDRLEKSLDRLYNNQKQYTPQDVNSWPSNPGWPAGTYPTSNMSHTDMGYTVTGIETVPGITISTSTFDTIKIKDINKDAK